MDHNRRARLAAAGLAATALCALAALVPQSADAAYLLRDVTAKTSEKFSNAEECAPAAVAVALPRGAYWVRIAEGPAKGEELLSPNLDDVPVGVVTGVRVRPQGRREVLWGAAPAPSPAACRSATAASSSCTRAMPALRCSTLKATYLCFEPQHGGRWIEPQHGPSDEPAPRTGLVVLGPGEAAMR